MHCTDFKLDHSVYNRYVYVSTVKPKNSLGGNNVWILLEPLTYLVHRSLEKKWLVSSLD